MSQSVSETTLYDRMGGDGAVGTAVDRFYGRVLGDPELKEFFVSASVPRLKAHQFAFLSQVLGGPRQYSGALMHDAHSKLAIEQKHFKGVAVHLIESCAN
jgi:hemoglobin